MKPTLTIVKCAKCELTEFHKRIDNKTQLVGNPPSNTGKPAFTIEKLNGEIINTELSILETKKNLSDSEKTDVKVVQLKQNEVINAGLAVDGSYDSFTSGAAQYFQEALKLPANRVVDTKTITLLQYYYEYLTNEQISYVEREADRQTFDRVTQGMGEDGTHTLGGAAKTINYRESKNMSTIDLLARILYVESIDDEEAMLAVAWTIMNRVSLEKAGKGDWTYDIAIDYIAKKIIPDTKVDMDATLRNVVLAPMQYTGLTGEWVHKGMGHPHALSPKTDSSRWQLAVQIAEKMINNPDSLEMLEGLERVTSFRALYRFTNVDKENRTAVLDGKTVYNIYIHGDNVFFK